LGRLRQGYGEFEASLGYIVRYYLKKPKWRKEERERKKKEREDG
jgi:hypothetical protein